MGDPIPLEQLLVHREWVRALARTLVRDESRADDVEQQTWLTAMERPPRHAGSLRAWLSAVVRTAARKARRSDYRRTRHELAAPPRDASASGADLVAEAELQHGLVREVLDLDEPYRATVLFRWFDGLPPREIAERMGVPVETVRTRLKRAQERLRERLDGRFGGDRRAWALLVLAWPTPSAPAPVAWPALPVAGVLAMTALKKTLAVAAVVALLAVGGWRLAHVVGEAPDGAAASHVLATPPEHAESGRTVRARAPDAAAPPVVTSEPADGAVVVVVRGPSGSPVADAKVESFIAEPLDSSDAGTDTDALLRHPPRLVAAAATDATGAALLRVPRVSVVLALRVTKAGFASATARTTSGDAASPGRATIVLVPGHALRGRVVTRDGRPVAGALVLAGGLSQRYAPPPSMVSRAIADADGRFAFDALDRGETLLWAAPPSGVLVRTPSVLVPCAADVVVVLPDGASFTGAVRDAGTSAPIEGAFVELSGSWNRELVSTTARTDAAGRFRIDAFPPGEAHVVVRAAGHVAYPRLGEPACQVDLRAGGAVTRDFELGAGCVLSGTVRGAGAPVAGASVTAAWVDPAGGRGPSTTTDAQGRYRFDTLFPGRYAVLVSAEGWFQDGFSPHWPETVRADLAPAATVVAVSAEAEARLDVEVARDRRIAGRVLGPDGRPVAGASVSAGFAESWTDGGSWRHATARSASDGSFALEGVPLAREASIRAQADGLGSADARVPLGPRGAESVELRFPATAPAVVRGRARASDDGSLEGGYVEWGMIDPEASVAEAQDAWSQALRAPLNPDGTFELTRHRAAGTLSLRVVTPGRPAATAVVRIVPETRLYEVEVLVGRGRSVVGRVVAANTAAPVDGASVQLAPRDVDEREGVWAPEAVSSFVGVTARGGEFVLRDLADGHYRVRVEARGFLPAVVDLDVPTSRPADVVLTPSRTLRGRARHADGTPVAGVSVQCGIEEDSHWGLSMRTGASGEFAFEDVPEGALWISFGAWTVFSGEQQPDVVFLQMTNVPVNDQPLDVVLERGERIAGRVVDTQGAGVASAFVQCDREGGGDDPQAGRSAVTRADGTFVVGGLRPGAHTVRATGSVLARSVRWGYRPSEPRTVAAGADGVVLVVTEGLSIEGRLVDPTGGALTGLRVAAHELDAAGRAVGASVAAVVDATGRFRIRGVPEGRHRLLLSDAMGRTTRLQIDEGAVVPAGAKELRLTVSERTTIAGRVRLPRGTDSASVTASRTGVGPASPASLRASVAFDGEFVIPGADPGAAYDVRCHVAGHLPAVAKGVVAGTDGVVLVPERGTSASGRVVDRNGQPVAKVLLAFTTDAADAPSSTTTDADGRFTVEGLAPGEYRVRFESFPAQADASRKREWRDCGTIRSGETAAVLRLDE